MTTRRRIPPIWLLALYILLAAWVVWLQGGDGMGDEGMNNVFTYMAALLAFTLTLFWFVIFSGYGGKVRLGVMALVTVSAVVGYNVLHLRGWTGAMIPIVSIGSGVPEVAYTEITAESSADFGAATPEDFPAYFGPRRNGHVDSTGLARSWNTTAPEVLWRVPVGAGWSGFAVVGNALVTLEQHGEEQVLIARDATTSAKLWSHAWSGSFDHPLGGPGPRSTPAVDSSVPGGRVYALGPRGHLVCVEGKDGSLVWEVSLLTHLGLTAEDDDAAIAYGRSGSPLLVDDLVIVPGGGKEGGSMAGLIAFDKATGEVAWEGPPYQISHSSPTLATLLGHTQVLMVNEDTVTGHDPADGSLLWEHPWPGRTPADANNSQAIAVDADRVLVSKGYGQGSELLRLQSTDAGWVVESLWAVKRSLRTKLTSAIVHGEHGYGLSDGILECVSLGDGKRVWKKGRYGHGHILLAGDLLVVLGEQGELTLVEASVEGGGEPLGTLQVLEGKTWNTFALAGNRAFVRNGTEAAGVLLPRTGE